jgi:acyl-CoA thioesterase YciA
MGMLEEVISTHLVMPEDLNPHGTLFGGQLAKWLIIADLVCAARLVGNPEGIILVNLNMNLKEGIPLGHLAVIKTKIAYLGKASITVSSRVLDNDSEKPAVTGLSVFTTVDKDNKPRPHRCQLPADYIEENRDIYEAALKIRNSS